MAGVTIGIAEWDHGAPEAVEDALAVLVVDLDAHGYQAGGGSPGLGLGLAEPHHLGDGAERVAEKDGAEEVDVLVEKVAPHPLRGVGGPAHRGVEREGGVDQRSRPAGDLLGEMTVQRKAHTVAAESLEEGGHPLRNRD